ncbi:MAG: isoprenylcysteine carboxylmethyltransferase family protein [bacterium]|nr:isoprenylcysteine carboxylmethyltransferase family protein [bacterium]
MDTIRYVIALGLLICLPAVFLVWVLIHPFARHWRTLGPARTYAVLSGPVVLLIAASILARKWLLATDFGTNLPLLAPALLCFVGASAITVKRRKHLTPRIMSGIPELSPEPEKWELLTDGIYAKIRHPRYVELFLWILGYSCVANYLSLYVACLMLVPALFVIVILEERELKGRFGDQYDEYCRNVPRFVPRFRRDSS